MVVDSIEISLEEFLIQEVAASLVNRHVQNGAADLEEILNNIILVTFELLQVGLYE